MLRVLCMIHSQILCTALTSPSMSSSPASSIANCTTWPAPARRGPITCRTYSIHIIQVRYTLDKCRVQFTYIVYTLYNIYSAVQYTTRHAYYSKPACLPVVERAQSGSPAHVICAHRRVGCTRRSGPMSCRYRAPDKV